MRALPAALASAQQAATGQPVISAVLRARRGAAARLDVTALYTGALADVATTVAAPANGNVVRARLFGGNVQTQSLAPVPGSAWTAWTALTPAFAPAAGLGVALAALGHSVALAFLTNSTTIAVYKSSNDGVTWSSFASVPNSGVATDVAISYAVNGDLLLVSSDNGGTIRAFRSSGGGAFAAAVLFTPAGAALINSVSVAYSGDWLVLFGWQDANRSLVGSALFGNGGRQTANTWSAVENVLGVGAGSGDAPVVSGFAWNADGGHATLVEQWAVLGGYSNNQAFSMECSSPAAFAGGFWTEPAPFPYSGPNGADLAPSQVSGQGSSYVAGGQNLVAILAPPADLDVSGRVVSIDYIAEHHAGSLLLTLDNADQLLTALATSRSTIGLRLDLALGYSTSAGALTSPLPQRWVVKVEDSWVMGRHLLSLTCHDGWQLLHQLSARREAQFGTTLGLPSLTVDQLLHWLCARAGIEYSPPASSTLRSRTPNFSVMPGQNFGTLMLDLLDTIEGWLLMTDTGATVIPLGTGDVSVYNFGGSGQHPLLQIFHTQELQSANLVTIYNGAHGEAIAAQAFDAADALLLGQTSHEHTDTQLETVNAQATANALLRKAQVSTPQHSLICPPQVAQELGDVVNVTDPLTGSVYACRVQAFTLKFDRDRGIWQQAIALSAV